MEDVVTVSAHVFCSNKNGHIPADSQLYIHPASKTFGVAGKTCLFAASLFGSTCMMMLSAAVPSIIVKWCVSCADRQELCEPHWLEGSPWMSSFLVKYIEETLEESATSSCSGLPWYDQLPCVHGRGLVGVFFRVIRSLQWCAVRRFETRILDHKDTGAFTFVSANGPFWGQGEVALYRGCLLLSRYSVLAPRCGTAKLSQFGPFNILHPKLLGILVQQMKEQMVAITSS